MSNANLGTAFFNVSGNASGAVNAANQANNALASMERVVAQNWWGIQNLGLAFAALPAAVAAGTGAAIKSAIQWEDALAAVARTSYDMDKSVSENAASAAQLGKELLSLAQRVPTDAFEIAQIAEAAGALGVAGEDVAVFTETVANLANTTDLTAESAATNLARIAALTGVGAAGFDNLASAITTAGVTTAATESEIANLSTRIAGVAKIVGLSADQVVGIAAATRSAGVQVEAGGTAIQKTFLDINAAVRQGGDDLQGWASIAGVTGDELRTMFQEDAATALVSVVSGLGNLNKAGGDVITMLDNVGVSEQRQIRTLLSLAAAQNQNINENVQLSTILGRTGDAFTDTTAYAEMLDRRYNTLSNQLQILKNQIFAAGQSLGSFFMPVVRTVVDLMQILIATVAGAPGPFKTMIAIFIGVATVLTSIGAAALLIGPRILIARSALRQLEESALQAANAQRILDASLKRTTAGMLSALGITGQLSRQIGVQGREAIKAAIATGNYANVQRALAAANINVASTGLTTITRMGTMVTWAGRLAAAFGWITLAITIATTAMAYFNQQSQRHKNVLEASGRARLDLIQAMRKETKGQEGAARGLMELNPLYQRLSQVAGRAGVSQETLFGIVSGGISDADELTGALNALKGSNEEFAKDTSSVEALQVLRNQWKNSSQEAGFLGGAVDDMSVAIGDSGGISEEAAKGLQKYADAMERVVDATMALPDAVRAQEEAEDGLEDAERDLIDAREDLAKVGDDIAKAEGNLTKARFDAAEAVEAVAEAEKDLADAERDAADALAKAEDDLADSQDRRIDTIEKISDLEEKLADLRKGPELKDLIKATNDLRQAQLNLLKSHRQVADAEWYLQYLREEGASNRDIEDAEIGLEQARIDEIDAATELSDSEEKLAELRDQSDELKEIEKLEREIASARRDLDLVNRQIVQSEEDLLDAREDASGKLAEERERDLERARMASEDATRAVTEAEEELADVREHTDLIEAVEDAERGVEDALWRLAEANVEVQKQTALMNGEQWDAARTARALADQLGILANRAPTEEQRSRLQGFIEQLKNVPNIPIVPEIGQPKMPDMGGFANDLAQEFGDAFGSALDDAIQSAIDEAMKDEDSESWFDKVWGFFEEFGGDAYDFFFETGPMLIEGLWLGIQKGGSELAGFIGRKFQEWIIDPVKRWLGIASPSTKMFQIGQDTIQGMIDGLIKKGAELFEWAKGLPTSFLRAIGDGAGWLKETGSRVILGLWAGIQGGWAYLSESFGKIAGWVKEKITNGLFVIGNGMWQIGRDLVDGFWKGIDSLKDWLKQKVTGWAESVAGWIQDGLGALWPDSPSKAGIDVGYYFGKGIEKGMQQSAHSLLASASQFSGAFMEAAAIDMEKFTPFTADEILAGSSGLNATLTPNILASLAAGTATTIINNDTFNLEAHTDADPDDIVNAYVFSKRVRTRS
jgi:TP901 family phage tail tape measure protein